MPFEEKTTWVTGIATAITAVGYSVVVFGQLGRIPADQIAYQWPMIVAIGVSIVLTIVGAILAGIGTGIAIGITGNGSTDDIGLTDERDKHIGNRGEMVGFYVAAAGMVGALVLTMLAYPYFWIANAIYFSFAVSTVVASAVKIVAYRRGF